MLYIQNFCEMLRKYNLWFPGTLLTLELKVALLLTLSSHCGFQVKIQGYFLHNQPAIFLLLPQSSIYMTSSQACSCKSNYRKAPLIDNEKRAIFEDIILIMWQALIQAERLPNMHTRRYCHTPADTARLLGAMDLD